MIPALSVTPDEGANASTLSPEAVVAAVREANGIVGIGFKPAGAKRTAQTGRIPEITKALALQGRAAVVAAGGELVRTFASSAAIIANIPPEAAPALLELDIVNYLEPSQPLHVTSVQQEPQDTSWGAHQVRAPAAWADSRGEDATLTILDTGIDQDHMLSGFGDIRAYDVNLLFAEPTFDDAWDDNGHGSHVAGIAVSYNNDVGFIGIAERADLINIVKVCGASGGCSAGAVAGALDWTATNGYVRQIVSMSLGDDVVNATIQEMIGRSYNAGNLLVAGAGNGKDDAFVEYPARDSRVIAVSGTNPDDTFAGWQLCERTFKPDVQTRSNHGPEVELSAPFTALSMHTDNRFDNNCGTSMATPVVSGVAALVWSVNTGWTAEEVRTHLRSTAIDLGSAGRDEHFGYGRVDAVAALALELFIDGPQSVINAGTYNWEAMPSGGNGSYTYQWEVKRDVVGVWQDLGTAKSQHVSVDSDYGSFAIKVTVTSNGKQSWDSMYVENLIGCTSRGC